MRESDLYLPLAHRDTRVRLARTVEEIRDVPAVDAVDLDFHHLYLLLVLFSQPQ